MGAHGTLRSRTAVRFRVRLSAVGGGQRVAAGPLVELLVEHVPFDIHDSVKFAPETVSAASTRSGLRSLYLVRIVFSVIWVVVVFTTSHSLKSGDAPSAVAAVLLVVYPLWDAIATVLELRTTGRSGSLDRIRVINVLLSIVAVIAMTIAVFSAFGAFWFLVAVIALRRPRTADAIDQTT